MKRVKLFVITSVLIVSLSACGVTVDLDTPMSQELASEYSFYEDSVENLRTEMKITPEEADGVFVILTSECGVDAEINQVFKNGGESPYYKTWFSGKGLDVYLDNGVVSRVLDGDTQLYPSVESEEEVSQPEVSEVVTHRQGEEFVGISDKDSNDLSVSLRSTVHNDKTGLWRLAAIAVDNTDISEYALSYYTNYFSSDDEIHAIVNFTTKCTASIRVVGDRLDVTCYEYVDGEEQDASTLFGGMLLNEYFVYLDNGDIELVQ